MSVLALRLGLGLSAFATLLDRGWSLGTRVFGAQAVSVPDPVEVRIARSAEVTWGPFAGLGCEETVETSRAGAAGPTLTSAVSRLDPVRLGPSRTEWAEGCGSAGGATPPD